MNREIRFRAWDNENKYMVISKQGVFTALRNSMNIVRQADGYYNDGDLLKPNKEKYILMQYTGLHDKNGKEIYEGDIVGDNKIKWIVKWNKHRMGFSLYPTTEQLYDEMPINVENKLGFKILGNIYDNPELIGGE